VTDTTGNFQDLLQFSQDTLYDLGEAFVLGNSNASTLTFGFSNSAGSMAVVAAPTGNTTLSLPNGGTLISNVNISAGTTSNNLSAFVFSNSNGVSFGLNGSTITASAAGGGVGGSINVSAGTTSNNVTALTFSNSNNVSFGLNGSTLTGSYALNVSAGTTSSNVTAVTLSNSYNVSFGFDGTNVTASANLSNDWFDNIALVQPNATGSGAMGAISNFTASASSLFVAPLHGYGHLFPFDITAGTCFFPDVSVSGSTATMSIAFTSVWRLGIYTLNASTLSLLNSASVSFGFAGAATNNSTGFAGGLRYASFPAANWSSSPVFRFGSRYWLAWFWSSAGALNQTGSMAGAFMFSTGQRSGLLGVSNLTATSNGAAPFYGIYTAQTAAMPASIGSNQLQKTASVAGFVPHLIMANNASLTVF
jgi:hypothetical protein